MVSVDVFLASEKAAVRLDPAQVSQDAIRGAVEGAGYRVAAPDATSVEASGRALTRQLGLLLAALFGVVLFVVVVGEGLGLFERLTDLVPWPVWLALVRDRRLPRLPQRDPRDAAPPDHLPHPDDDRRDRRDRGRASG